MASVWVPFTSGSKEAIADYDEIQKEITLALRECGRRLGLFLRRRERAQSEFRRRNIFELYIEEVVEACNRLKGGKLPKQQLKEQLQKIASSRTGGMKTDEVLGKKGSGPEGLPNSIIVTPEGVEGEVPVEQEVTVSVDDEGAEAASASVAANGSKSEPEEPLKKIRATVHSDQPPKRKGIRMTKADQLPLFAAKGSADTEPLPSLAKSVKQKRGRPSGPRKT
jgi:DNA topoisomerase-6 subunit B